MTDRRRGRVALFATAALLVLAVGTPAVATAGPATASPVPTAGALVATDGAATDAAPVACGDGDGTVFTTDGGLRVVHPGGAVATNPFVNATTLAFSNITVRADGNASVVVATATERGVCLRDVDPTAAVTVAPATGPTVVLETSVGELSYGAMSAENGSGVDLRYAATTGTTLRIAGGGFPANRTVEAVDAGSGAVLDSAPVDVDGRLALTLPGGDRSVALRFAPNATATPTPTPTAGQETADGTPAGDGTPVTSPSTPTPTPTPATPVAPPDGGWVGELVDYRPTPQTTHVGGFLPVAALLWLSALWLLATRDDRNARSLALVLVAASLRATSDLLQVLLEGLVWVETSVAAINLLLEVAIAASFAAFAVAYADVAPERARQLRRSIGAVAAVAAALVVTDPLHGLVFADVTVASEPFSYVATRAGPGGWALFGLNSALLAGGGWLVLRSLLDGPLRSVWRPVGVVGGGLCLALGVGVVSVAGRGPVPGYDYTAAGVNYFLLMTAGTLLAHGMKRVRTSGEASVIVDLEDAIVILDDAWRVAAFNPAAEDLFPSVERGRSFEDLLAASIPRPPPGETVTREVSMRAPSFAKRRARTDGLASAGSVEGASDAPPDAAESVDEGVAPDRDGTVDAVESGDSGEGVATSVPSTGETAADDGTSSDAEFSADDGTPTAREADAERRHFLATVTTVSTATGSVVGYAVRFADVTSLRRRVDALEAKNERLDRFASAITRDLRSPLTEAERATESAMAHLESAETATDVRRSAVQASLATVGNALDRMAGIVQDVLGLARDSSFDVHPRDVAFGDVVESAIAAIDDADGTVRIESTGTVEADPDNLRRILEHLFTNAVEHGEAPVTIAVGVTADGFYVADDGPGVAVPDGDDPFAEGVTTKPDGSGLGLAIVRRRAEAQGWDVRLDESADGARVVVSGVDVDRDDGREGDGS